MSVGAGDRTYVFDGNFLAMSEDTGLSRLLMSFTGDLLGPWLVTMKFELNPLLVRGKLGLESSARTLRMDGLRVCVLLICACDEDLLGTLDCGIA
jgi:hypothetical protein